MKLFRISLTLAVALSCGFFVSACGSSPDDATVTTEDLVAGTGATAVTGDTLTVAYVGTLTDGTQFDSNNTFVFRLGAGAVIKGWDRGIPGMRVGGKRRLTIPPILGYGSQAQNSIPANSTLKFDITLNAIAGK